MNDASNAVELSVVMPCLNEADTLEVCIAKALRAMSEHGIVGEVIVADNGSTDGSQEIASGAGARVVPVQAKGYGNALQGGIAAARGRFIIMGDADDSYDFTEIPRFVDQLRNGFDLVQGCRLPGGGGKVMQSAMPTLHRWLGNPLFTFMARRMFYAPIHDIYCGLRGFTRELYDRLKLFSPGMEFATEMVIKASLTGARIAEVPITLHPDGRKAHAPHLKTFRDGWRTLRFFLMYSPKWSFFLPGMLMILLGLVGYAIALPGLQLLGVHFDAHTLLLASGALMLGYQSVMFAITAKINAIREGLVPDDRRLDRLFQWATFERGLHLGMIATAVGIGLIGTAVGQWWLAGFGDLNYAVTMRLVIPGLTAAVLGFQTILSGLLISTLGMRRQISEELALRRADEPVLPVADVKRPAA
jgi:glycosyltransferase involved in cell wall biosynthesis